MKHVIFFFCILSLKASAQTAQEQLLDTYVNGVFLYEPAFIAKNKIAAVSTYETRLREDSVLYSYELDRMLFRKDGKPVRTCSWIDFHRDSVWTDFTYDSLGNLVEMRRWKNRINQKEEFERIYKLCEVYFQYFDNGLQKRKTKVFTPQHSFPYAPAKEELITEITYWE